jgi:hypothetical protein
VGNYIEFSIVTKAYLDSRLVYYPVGSSAYKSPRASRVKLSGSEWLARAAGPGSARLRPQTLSECVTEMGSIQGNVKLAAVVG